MLDNISFSLFWGVFSCISIVACRSTVKGTQSGIVPTSETGNLTHLSNEKNSHFLQILIITDPPPTTPELPECCRAGHFAGRKGYHCIATKDFIRWRVVTVHYNTALKFVGRPWADFYLARTIQYDCAPDIQKKKLFERCCDEYLVKYGWLKEGMR